MPQEEVTIHVFSNIFQYGIASAIETSHIFLKTDDWQSTNSLRAKTALKSSRIKDLEVLKLYLFTLRIDGFYEGSCDDDDLNFSLAPKK